jgi:hypothetical protein
MKETYEEFKDRIIREAREVERLEAARARELWQARGETWAEAYQAGKAERDRTKRWLDLLFAFLVGAIAGFFIAAVLAWTAN